MRLVCYPVCGSIRPLYFISVGSIQDMSFKAPESLAEQIAKHIGDEIIAGRLPGKERIQELKVVKDLEVSRGSVREALLILESRHLIEIYPRRGALVTELTEESVSSLYELYINVLSMLTSLVAQRWKEGDLDVLLAQLQQIQTLANSRAPEARMEVIKAGFDLMTLAYPIAGNSYLQGVLEDLQPSIHRTYVRAMQVGIDEVDISINFFAGLMQAVLQKNGDRVKQIVTEYGEHQMALVLSSL